MSEVTEAKLGVQRSEDGRFVSYGAIVDGVFHAFAGERTGDHDERQQAGLQAIEDEKAASKGSK